jgi:hypothetical protein
MDSDGTVVRGGVQYYYGPTWKSIYGTVYACRKGICNGAFRTEATSTSILLVLSLFATLFIKKNYI